MTLLDTLLVGMVAVAYLTAGALESGSGNIDIKAKTSSNATKDQGIQESKVPDFYETLGLRYNDPVSYTELQTLLNEYLDNVLNNIEIPHRVLEPTENHDNMSKLDRGVNNGIEKKADRESVGRQDNVGHVDKNETEFNRDKTTISANVGGVALQRNKNKKDIKVINKSPRPKIETQHIEQLRKITENGAKTGTHRSEVDYQNDGKTSPPSQVRNHGSIIGSQGAVKEKHEAGENKQMSATNNTIIHISTEKSTAENVRTNSNVLAATVGTTIQEPNTIDKMRTNINVPSSIDEVRTNNDVIGMVFNTSTNNKGPRKVDKSRTNIDLPRTVSKARANKGFNVILGNVKEKRDNNALGSVDIEPSTFDDRMGKNKKTPSKLDNFGAKHKHIAKTVDKVRTNNQTSSTVGKLRANYQAPNIVVHLMTNYTDQRNIDKVRQNNSNLNIVYISKMSEPEQTTAKILTAIHNSGDMVRTHYKGSKLADNIKTNLTEIRPTNLQPNKVIAMETYNIKPSRANIMSFINPQTSTGNKMETNNPHPRIINKMRTNNRLPHKVDKLRTIKPKPTIGDKMEVHNLKEIKINKMRTNTGLSKFNTTRKKNPLSRKLDILSANVTVLTTVHGLGTHYQTHTNVDTIRTQFHEPHSESTTSDKSTPPRTKSSIADRVGNIYQVTSPSNTKGTIYQVPKTLNKLITHYHVHNNFNKMKSRNVDNAINSYHEPSIVDEVRVHHHVSPKVGETTTNTHEPNTDVIEGKINSALTRHAKPRTPYQLRAKDNKLRPHYQEPRTVARQNPNQQASWTVENIKSTFHEPSTVGKVRTNYNEPSTVAKKRTNYNEPSTVAKVRTNYNQQRTVAKVRAKYDEPSTVAKKRTNHNEPSTVAKVRTNYNQQRTVDRVRTNYNQQGTVAKKRTNHNEPSTVGKERTNYNQQRTVDRVRATHYDLSAFDKWKTLFSTLYQQLPNTVNQVTSIQNQRGSQNQEISNIDKLNSHLYIILSPEETYIPNVVEKVRTDHHVPRTVSKVKTNYHVPDAVDKPMTNSHTPITVDKVKTSRMTFRKNYHSSRPVAKMNTNHPVPGIVDKTRPNVAKNVRTKYHNRQRTVNQFRTNRQKQSPQVSSLSPKETTKPKTTAEADTPVLRTLSSLLGVRIAETLHKGRTDGGLSGVSPKYLSHQRAGLPFGELNDEQAPVVRNSRKETEKRDFHKISGTLPLLYQNQNSARKDNISGKITSVSHRGGTKNGDDDDDDDDDDDSDDEDKENVSYEFND